MGIIKIKRSWVALNCSTMGSVMPIDYAARVIVELLTETKAVKKDEDALAFPKLVRLLELVFAETKKHSFSKDALISLVKEEFLKDKTSLDLLDLIQNCTFCFFPTEDGKPMQFSTVSQNPPLLRNDYGDETYIRRATVEEKPVKKAKKEPIRDGIDSPEINPIKKRNAPKEDLTSLPEIIALKKKYNQLERSGKRYYWEWRVSTEDYEEYQSLLRKVDFSDRTRDKVRLCAKQLAFYIAEWYKREYDGFNTSSCLEDLGISSSFNREIWDHSHVDGDRPYCTPDTHINEWLYSMYVQGGFPIKYTKRSFSFVPLFDEIWGDDQRQDTISEEQLFELTQGFDGNQVVKNSLISGSLHEYYRYLRIQETMPIAESDMDKEPFSEFIRNLQEGKKKYYEQYLKPVWFLYLDPRDEIIEGVVRVSFGRRDDNCYIPYECLQYWGIPGLGSLKEFDIEVTDSASGLSKSIHFTKTGPGDYPYVGWSQENIITLPISHEKSGEIRVSLVTISGHYPIGESFKMGDSRQFYKTKRPYEWSSKTDNTAHTAILYNPVKLKLCDENTLRPEDCPKEKFFEDGGQAWKWLSLSEKVVLAYENGESVSYAPHNNSLEISFKIRKDTIKYVNFRDVVFYRQDDEELVQSAIPLLTDRGFTILYTPYGSKQPEKVRQSDCDVYYKCVGDPRFSKWESNTLVKQGLLQIKVVYTAKGVSVTKQAFYLPSSDAISRYPEENRIEFGHGLEEVYAPKKDGYYALDRNGEGNFYYYDNIENGYNPQSDTIPFRIGRLDEGYIIVNVYRSCFCKELYLKTQAEPIKRYDRSKGIVEIPFALRNNFEVRTIGNDGVTRAKCGENLYLGFDFNIKSGYSASLNVINDFDNGFRYYLVVNRAVQNGVPGQFQLETNPGEYRFYYWSMNAGEEPVLLEQSFNEETKVLSVNPSYLVKNHTGIIFQSLRGVSPRHYMQPVYGDKEYSNRWGIRVKCFDIASEHEIPFQVFPCLTEIFTTKTDPFSSLASFWVDLMRSRNWAPTSKDLKNLHRFASEYLFEWILIPKRLWRKLLLNDKTNPDLDIRIDNPACRDIMTRLFRTSPNLQIEGREYLEKILEIYWNVPSFLDWDFRRSSKLENRFLQCIRGAKGDRSCLDQDYASRMNQLKEFHDCNTLYERVYRLMVQLKK